MLRRILAAGIILIYLQLFAAPMARAQEQVAVAFYNLENFFNPEDNPETNDEDFTPQGNHRYTEEIFRQKTDNMARVLSQLGTSLVPQGAALIGVCEIEDDRVLQSLISHPDLSGRRYRFIRFDGPDKRGVNVGLLYQSKLFKVLQAKSVPVDLRPAGGGYTRDVLWVTGMLQQDTLDVLVNHWPSRSGGEAASAPKRAIAAETVRNLVSEIRSKRPNAAIIVMGDLNDDPVSTSVARVLGATGDKKRAKGDHLYNPWLSFYEQGYGTLCHADHWNLFDQILLSGNLIDINNAWVFSGAEVFSRDFLKTKFGKYRGYPHRSFNGNRWINGYSDHFPTIIYLKKAKQKSNDQKN
jgi:predicted extracellular nuclease